MFIFIFILFFILAVANIVFLALYNREINLLGKKLALVEETQEACRKLFDALEQEKRFWHESSHLFTASYTFTESDLLKGEKKMLREAKTRCLCALARHIGKEIELEEVLKDGLLVGYRIAVEVRQTEADKTHEPTTNCDTDERETAYS